LLKAADARSYSWRYQCYFLATVWFQINGRSIRWSLRGETRPRRVPLSKTELKDPNNIARGITTKEIRVPTGVLKIVADTDFGKKAQIAERPDHRLELRVEEILEKFEALADAANTQEVELARRREEWKLADWSDCFDWVVGFSLGNCVKDAYRASCNLSRRKLFVFSFAHWSMATFGGFSRWNGKQKI
jgi:hypothetical protein